MSAEMPETRPAEFEPFFAALRAGKLAFPRCSDCHRFHWYPMKMCPHCRSAELVWTPMTGHGRLFSWTVVRHPFDSAQGPAPPFVVGLVEFEEAPGVRLVTNVVDSEASELAIGVDLEPVLDQAIHSETVQFRKKRAGSS
ncbi:OB-fold domain-containing protein [Micromonospora sp. STR1s_5]|nr:OB-fold domain-containing protein [Micromonospora sp. STR1s_5]